VGASAVKLAWLLRRSPVVMPIPGTRSIDHLRENLAALELELGDADENGERLKLVRCPAEDVASGTAG
jgi:aryl-alcohol dehydrogenase-like predicted oxidoreductase